MLYAVMTGKTGNVKIFSLLKYHHGLPRPIQFTAKSMFFLYFMIRLSKTKSNHHDKN